MNFLAELKRRNVFRMAGLYLVGASAAIIEAAFKQLPSGEPAVYLIARQDVAGYNSYLDNVGPIGQMCYFGDLYAANPWARRCCVTRVASRN